MTAQEIKNRLTEICTLFAFEYNGKSGNVDPYSESEFLLCFDGKEKTVSSINAVMNEPFFNGKSLSEIYDKIHITEW